MKNGLLHEKQSLSVYQTLEELAHCPVVQPTRTVEHTKHCEA